MVGRKGDFLGVQKRDTASPYEFVDDQATVARFIVVEISNLENQGELPTQGIITCLFAEEVIVYRCSFDAEIAISALGCAGEVRKDRKSSPQPRYQGF